MKNELCVEEYGTKEWYLNGRLHRKDGPAIEYPDGRKEWYINGERHREDGPAIEQNGTKRWYLNGRLLETLPQDMLINYMKVNNYIVSHLLIDPDPLVRESASKYKWKEVV
jgi:hypothetical protein